ncbi:MAG: aldehyde dehydrogenase (NADP(+)) [Pseudomonadota bacterium]
MSITGNHLIAGQWVQSPQTFTVEDHAYGIGSPDLAAQACKAAEQAFTRYGTLSRAARADFLDAIAQAIDDRGAALTEIAMRETGLPQARLEGERGRTVGQLRLFADYIRKGDYLDRQHDPALPDRTPLPRPDLRLIQHPIGPVAVFGASNFPLAFSTAGGDTASALAAGCPVIVKGHPAHPGTGEIVAQAIDAAVRSHDMPPGVFSFIQDNSHAVAHALVGHPLIQAVGFTGSHKAGRALFDLCAQREAPIPFFGELGSINPVFLLPQALAQSAQELAAGWVGSLTLGAGQFCTNPGLIIMIESPAAQAFIDAAGKAAAASVAQNMLTDSIAQAYRTSSARIADVTGVRQITADTAQKREARAAVFETDGTTWLANKVLAQEVFGPHGVIVRAADVAQMRAMAESLEGQLTCTMHLTPDDHAMGAELLPILRRKAGRVLAGGFPTGVEVADSMVHGGPYPASTNFGATSVGTLAVRRFLRPVCYQNIPQDLLPEDLRGISRGA